MIYQFERFVYDITEINLCWQRLSTSVMREYDLKGSYGIYFIKLHGASEGLVAVELAAVCNKDKADVSRDMSDLEKRGLIQRIKVGETGYRARIVLTKDGKKIADEIIQQVESAVKVINEKMTDEEREGLFHRLDLITDSLRDFCENGIPQK